ncbi:MAG: hypothetical protein JW884_02060 [Deltaproteobacteria bacterium]|nr:hypothetical protein [Deltaproteobacteria bacterium]
MLKRITLVQMERAGIQNALDLNLRGPSISFSRECRVQLRALDAWMHWWRVVKAASEAGGSIAASDSPVHRTPPGKIKMLMDLENETARKWEILMREVEIEIVEDRLHPGTRKAVIDVLNLVIRNLEQRRELGLLGVDLSSYDQNTSTVREGASIAC